MYPQWLFGLTAAAEHRVEAGEGILEHHRRPSPAKAGERAGIREVDRHSGEMSAPLTGLSGARSKPSRPRDGRGLSRAGRADQRHEFARATSKPTPSTTVRPRELSRTPRSVTESARLPPAGPMP